MWQGDYQLVVSRCHDPPYLPSPGRIAFSVSEGMAEHGVDLVIGTFQFDGKGPTQTPATQAAFAVMLTLLLSILAVFFVGQRSQSSKPRGEKGTSAAPDGGASLEESPLSDVLGIQKLPGRISSRLLVLQACVSIFRWADLMLPTFVHVAEKPRTSSGGRSSTPSARALRKALRTMEPCQQVRQVGSMSTGLWEGKTRHAGPRERS